MDIRCLILTLLVTISAGAIAFAATSSAKIIVDDDESGDFTRVQDAINASKDGDVIVVLNGTYHEMLVIDKSITLRGKDEPIIDSQRLYRDDDRRC